VRHGVCLEPVAQHQQPAHRRLELVDVLDSLARRARHAHTRGHLRLVHIQRALALDDHVHPDLPLDTNEPSPARDLENRRV
jgi:hypothetical protein